MKLLLACALVGFSVILSGCSGEKAPQSPVAQSKKMIVLGVDGMDPRLLQEMLDSGELPNFKRLVDSGGFQQLGTSSPPQSPVAWSNFITGMNPGGHGLFDFLALDRSTMKPYLSSSTVRAPSREPLELGDWRLPLGSAQTVLLRKGTAFWELLERAGVNTTIVRMPANYPPVPTRGDSLSGMGTPDMRGTSGTFMFFSTNPAFAPGEVSGGDLRRFEVQGDRLVARIIGPPNELRRGSPALSATLEVVPDPDDEVVVVRGGDRELRVRANEWTQWIPLEIQLLPGLPKVHGMVRLYVKSAHPETEIYVSPVDIDPRQPAIVISSPDDYSARIAEAVGPFYTEEMPEETKALSAHVLSPAEFLAQTEIVLEESRRMLDFELGRFAARQGAAFLFFYIGSVDQRHHMMGRHIDKYHPSFSAHVQAQVSESMRSTYRQVDDLLGTVLGKVGPDVAVVIMSDHGFSRFYRQAHLNAWLRDAGYLFLKNEKDNPPEEWLSNIDWSRTRAFSIGLNSLYINVAGREKFGIVPATERLNLAREIAGRLRTWTDESNGQPVVTRPSLREEIYRGPYLAEAPDIIVGYGNGYRGSWATSKGQTAAILLEDNVDEWSADHCVDPDIVPGVLVSNLKLTTAKPQLTDLTVGVLGYFGVERDPAMRGIAPF
ncbi:MAG: alkaline phosphatase family protein [Methylococcaceae bacterium]|nr:alkaline phosphatase family protein [Methylococcaceae bacterium]